MINQVNIFLLSFGLLQAVLLGVYLTRKEKKDAAYTFIVLILLVAALQMTFKIINKVWMQENIRILYRCSYALPYLMGPLVYLFTRSRTGFSFQRNQLLHFIPFLYFATANALQLLYKDHSVFLNALTPNAVNSTLVMCSSIGIYAFASWRQITTSNPELKTFIVGVTIVEVLTVLGWSVMYNYDPMFRPFSFVFAALTLMIYWMTYKVMTEPYYFLVPAKTTADKYHHSGLKETEAAQIFLDVRKYLEEHRSFLDPDITSGELADRLNITRHKLSQAINMKSGKGYDNLINSYRLQEVQARLRDPKFTHYSIAAIAFDCGFKSVAGFNRIFKRHTGLTPSAFRAMNSN